MISQDLERAARSDYDLVIAGGGIYGASLLLEASRHGLRCGLFEAGDFGGLTSWNSLRILHGGLRYLQSLDFGRFRQSVEARRWFARAFPDLVLPLPCLMPLYGRGLKRPAVMRAALLANDVLSHARNDGVAAALRIPRGRILDARATLAACPALPGGGLQGAALWHDYVLRSSERVLMEMLRWAASLGATAVNYAPVDDVETEAQRVTGVRVRSASTGVSCSVAARTVINCAGPQVGELAGARAGTVSSLFEPSLAFNLLLDAELPGDCAVAVSAPAAGAPVLFLVPRAAGLLAGTMHLPRPPGTDNAVPSEGEIAGFLAQIRAAVPALQVHSKDVRRVFAGLLPARAAGSAELAHQPKLVDHARSGGPQGLFSVSGVKFTTAPEVAARLLRMTGLVPAAPRMLEPGSPWPLSAATALLTDAARLWSTDADPLRETLRGVRREEAVSSIDDLILRRTNWGSTALDPDAVRGRIREIVPVDGERLETGT